MNTSPSYQSRKLGEIQSRLREVRYELGTVLGGRSAEQSELRLLDELVLLIEDRRATARPVQAPPWMPHKLNGREAL